MKRLSPLLLCAALLLCGLGATAAQAAEFGLTDLDVYYEEEDGSPALDAGSHPYAVTFNIDAVTEELESGQTVPAGAVKTIEIEQPSGFAGHPSAVETCPTALFLEAVNDESIFCPNETVLGRTTTTVGAAGEVFTKTVPVFNMDAPPGAILKLGFIVQGIPVTFEVGLSEVYPFNPLVRISNISQGAEFYASNTTIWGYPRDTSHDSERGTCLMSGAADECPVPSLPEIPFITLPRSCTGPVANLFQATSWESPLSWVTSPPVLSHDDSEPPQLKGMEDCAGLEPFAPEVASKPTSRAAESPSGLQFELSMTNEGLLDPDGRAESDIKQVVLTLPQGVSANPALAAGLGACTQAQFGAESVDSSPGEGCPASSKIGTVEATSPLLEGTTLKGQLFVAQPYENPFGELLALYLVVREPKLGVFVGLPGRIEADPNTGQLTSTFGEPGFEIPQFPLGELKVSLDSGPRGPLVTPPGCGSYEIGVQLTPWADPASPLPKTSVFALDSDCPPTPPPFNPGFRAGSVNNQAKAHSPFTIQITRSDRERPLTSFQAKLPPGLTGKLAGLGRCPEAAIAAAASKSGTAEAAAPSCPASSRIGSVATGAGVGPDLTWVGGSLYLSGPYKGAPISTVAIVPALAGPFDLGTVVVRQALQVDPKSAEITAVSDPFPQILAGIPLKVREIRASIDRPGFMLNPTSCNPFGIPALIAGGATPASAQDRYQAAGCASLGFKPKLKITLRGGTRRSANPSLRAVLTPRPGDANIAGAVVTLPPSAFLDQAHIRTICTRVQFAAHNCPKGSVYGFAKATTPILDGFAEGPVYLRSSNNELPDLVMALKGPANAPVEVEVVGRIDSKNRGIRTSFEGTPDIPVSRLVLTMQGGKKGLIDNSRDLCARKYRAQAKMVAHNGRRVSLRPVVKAAGCKKGKKRGGGKGKSGKRG